jgi:histone H3/H4
MLLIFKAILYFILRLMIENLDNKKRKLITGDDISKVIKNNQIK